MDNWIFPKSSDVSSHQERFLSKRRKALDLGHQERGWSYLPSPEHGWLTLVTPWPVQPMAELANIPDFLLCACLHTGHTSP